MMSLSIDSGSDDRDIEAGDDEEEGDEKVDNEKRMKEEEEMKKAKERQAFLENLYVLICMIIIVAMAVVIVIVKVNIFKTDPNITFIPLDQQVHSTKMYTGNGFIPCKGYVPTPNWCNFPQYRAHLQRPNNIGEEDADEEEMLQNMVDAEINE